MPSSQMEIRKVKDLKDENLADYSTQRISSAVRFNLEHKRHAQVITVTPDGVIIAGTPIHRANQEQGIEEEEVNVLDIPADKIQHAQFIYDAVPENSASLIAWLTEGHRYYLNEGAPYREEHKNAKGETITEFLGSLCGWSHESVRKAIVIGKSEFADELTRQMDDEGLSLDAAYHRLKDVESEPTGDEDESNQRENNGKPKHNRSRGVIGGNTPAFEQTEDDVQKLKLLFAEEGNRLHKQVSGDLLPDGCSLRINRSRNGDIESFSCTYRTPEGVFTAYYVPDNTKKRTNE